VLPARLDSTRLPGKVLADIDGRTMLEHVWRRVRRSECFDRIVVATDSARVAEVARGFGAEVALTGPAESGTARVGQVIRDPGVAVVNVQADQPLLDPCHLALLVGGMAPGEVTTLVAPGTGDPTDPARVKVEVDPEGRATAFTRIWRGGEGPWRLHVGLYGFAAGMVGRCLAAPAPPPGEDLEQVAWLRAGIPIRAVAVDRVAQSVDTPADLAFVRERLRRSPEES
jgi:3-deoxy-manno-octulosonate cytidylyltransferase (CMP-KDO synthetase)